MLFQVAQVRVLGRLFLLVCIMDQEVEAVRLGICSDGSQKLLLMKNYQLLDSLAEHIQQTSAFSACVSRGSPLKTAFGIL